VVAGRRRVELDPARLLDPAVYRMHAPEAILRPNPEVRMLWTIAVVLVVLWLLGMVTSYTLNGLVHLLLLLAIAAVLIRVIQGRRPI